MQRLAAVVAIETGALEDYADGSVHLAHCVLAYRALADGRFGESLYAFEPGAAIAIGARVLVGRHRVVLDQFGSACWHSTPMSANNGR